MYQLINLNKNLGHINPGEKVYITTVIVLRGTETMLPCETRTTPNYKEPILNFSLLVVVAFKRGRCRNA